MLSDKKLVHQLKNGDQDTLRTIYLEHKDFLLTLANALLHDISLAEDVVHDVFVNFTRNIPAFTLTGRLRSYLAVCTANQARAILRKKKVRRESAELTSEPQIEPPPCPMETQETAQKLRLYLASLSDEQREAVVLRIKAGLKFKDIARIQQTTISTVQGRYRYGIDKLRSLLNGELEK